MSDEQPRKVMLDLSTRVTGQVGESHGSVHLQSLVEDFDAALSWIAIQYSKLDGHFENIGFSCTSCAYRKDEDSEVKFGLNIIMNGTMKCSTEIVEE